MRPISWIVIALMAPRVALAQSKSPNFAYAEIRVIDADTGRGVPLVELETTNGLKFVTDNAGRVAFQEPGLIGREVFFFVKSHGYEVKKDGFGFAGVRVTPSLKKPAEIKIHRTMIAERLCRLTGEGRYRDTLLLGHKPPIQDSPHPGNVVGQDTIQSAIYRGKVYHFWGDTLKIDYPLGLFRTAGATTPIPDDKFDPSAGLAYDYFTDKKTGFARAMMPLPERPEGVIWVHALFVVPDEKGTGKLATHYSRRKGLGPEYEQGVAVWDDDAAIFKPAAQFPVNDQWRRPSGHPIHFEADGVKWLLFGSPTPNVRVPATLKDVLDPVKYEAFTCVGQDGPDLGDNQKPVWKWQKDLPPTTSKMESNWIKSKKLAADQARFCPADAANPGDRVILHRGSVRWNEHRKRWIMIAGQIEGKSSYLGEVWYAEADHPTGPFKTAVKILTHNKQTFYNVCHHPFLDSVGGRFVHFEGTYTNDFSGNPDRTPRYNYNQILYRLDLNETRLAPAR
jgi:hypothetical protein